MAYSKFRSVSLLYALSFMVNFKWREGRRDYAKFRFVVVYYNFLCDLWLMNSLIYIEHSIFVLYDQFQLPGFFFGNILDIFLDRSLCVKYVRQSSAIFHNVCSTCLK